MRALRSFLFDRSGQFAIIFGLCAVPVAGAAGLAIDYTKAVNVQTHLQNEVDKLALAVASGGIDAEDAAWLANASDTLSQRMVFGSSLGNVEVSGEWVDIGDFQVTGSLEMQMSVGRIVFAGPMEISASSTARYKGAAYRYKVPEVTHLDPEAWDYNRISVYCFDPDEADNRSANYGRGEMTEIADNDGGSYEYDMPECDAGQALSLKLWNVREAKHHGDNPETSNRAKYTYYTDTVIENDVEKYDLDGHRIVETVLCDTLEECKPKSRRGIGVIPHGKNRDPEISKEACEPGKYRYYGFEDRPPENGGSSDRDYDDIRIIIECPVKVLVGDETVRLVR